MAENWYPGAIRKEIGKFSRSMSSTNRGTVLHIAVSEASSLYGYFSGAAVCSTGYVRRGTAAQIAHPNGMADCEQYVSYARIAPAQLDGNRTLHSWETQGGLGADAQTGAWDPAQMRRLAHIFAWEHQHLGKPLELMTSSLLSQRGLGYHRLGIDPWRAPNSQRWSSSRGKVCPGSVRITQVAQILNMARALVGAGTVVIPGPVTPVGNGGGVKNWVQQGDRGPLVRELQQHLRNAGWSISIDGIFGPATLAAVKQYQASRGLVVDGIAGDATFGALRSGKPPISVAAEPTLRQGSVSPYVGRVQRFLGITDDNIFGPKTKAAVIAYQRGVGLTADGIVGPLTWAKINAGVRPGTPTPSNPAPAPVDSGRPLLRRGSHGAWVSKLQAHLRSVYPAYAGRLVVDGAFGPATEAVVKEFQRRSGLVADGIVGPLTWAKLGI